MDMLRKKILGNFEVALAYANVGRGLTAALYSVSV